HLGDVGAAVAARAAFGGGDAPVHRAAAVAIAAIIIAIAVTRVAIAVAIPIIVAVARRRQDGGEAAEHDRARDDLARADAVVVIAIARHRGGAADQHRAGGGRADRGLRPGFFCGPSHDSVSFTCGNAESRPVAKDRRGARVTWR